MYPYNINVCGVVRLTVEIFEPQVVTEQKDRNIRSAAVPFEAMMKESLLLGPFLCLIDLLGKYGLSK